MVWTLFCKYFLKLDPNKVLSQFTISSSLAHIQQYLINLRSPYRSLTSQRTSKNQWPNLVPLCSSTTSKVSTCCNYWMLSPSYPLYELGTRQRFKTRENKKHNWTTFQILSPSQSLGGFIILWSAANTYAKGLANLHTTHTHMQKLQQKLQADAETPIYCIAPIRQITVVEHLIQNVLLTM